MAEISLPVIVTAVANSDLEGFLSGTLFAQGWNVVYRALDSRSLEEFLNSYAERSSSVVLIYSPDLPGMTPDCILELQGIVKQVIGFAEDLDSSSGYIGVVQPPRDATSLISLIRGVVRAPLIRSQTVEKSIKRRARVVAIASPAGSSGCSTLALNLAMELSVLDKETLLIDADVRRPAIAPLLAIHKLGDEEIGRLVSTKFSVSEFTRARVENIRSYLDLTVQQFDFVIIDLGSVEGLDDSLTDRRWTSSLVHWSCDQADDLWLVGKSDVLGLIRMENLARNFARISIQARISVLLNMRSVGRRGREQESSFISSVSSLKPKQVFTLPKDARAVVASEEQRAALIEVNSRSQIRKAIAKLAVELTA